jgi:uncharacterized damage-inducible protein DinB
MSTSPVSAPVRYAFGASHISPGWISPLSAAIKAVSWETAQWKPSPDVSSIWEIVVHANRYAEDLLHDLTRKPGFHLPDWPEIGSTTKSDWKATKDHALFVISELERLAESLSDSELSSPPPGMKTPRAERILDIAVHGAYHAGQIIKMKQMYKAAARSG